MDTWPHVDPGEDSSVQWVRIPDVLMRVKIRSVSLPTWRVYIRAAVEKHDGMFGVRRIQRSDFEKLVASAKSGSMQKVCEHIVATAFVRIERGRNSTSRVLIMLPDIDNVDSKAVTAKATKVNRISSSKKDSGQASQENVWASINASAAHRELKEAKMRLASQRGTRNALRTSARTSRMQASHDSRASTDSRTLTQKALEDQRLTRIADAKAKRMSTSSIRERERARLATMPFKQASGTSRKGAYIGPLDGPPAATTTLRPVEPRIGTTYDTDGRKHERYGWNGGDEASLSVLDDLGMWH